MLGASNGAVCKLSRDEDVTTVLGIGEGIETTLSLRHLPEFGLTPVWACCSAERLAAFPVLAEIEVLWVAVDHDEAGLRAAERVADRWTDAGREVFLIRSTTEKADLNDIVRRRPHG